MTGVLSSAFAVTHQPKPLPVDSATLDGLSEKRIRSHWDNNYGGSVAAENAAKQKLTGFQADEGLPTWLHRGRR